MLGLGQMLGELGMELLALLHGECEFFPVLQAVGTFLEIWALKVCQLK
jgi:hypothetical protein